MTYEGLLNILIARDFARRFYELFERLRVNESGVDLRADEFAKVLEGTRLTRSSS